MKNIVVVSGSPRKGGNSDLLCDKLIEGALSVGHKTEKIFIGDQKINYCTGCGYCFNKKKCSQKDDMTEILEKMIASDVIVMASPVYFYTISGQMKTFIDRCCGRYTELTGKEFCFIMTAQDTNLSMLNRTLECFRGFTDCLDDAKERAVIYGTGVWHKGEIKGKKAMEEAYHLGVSL